MERELIKNEDGSFSFKSITETVRLEDLEAELANLEKLERECNDFNAWVDTLPEDKKVFVQRQYFVVPQELRDKIELLKNYADNI
jgi:hypothetical protein